MEKISTSRLCPDCGVTLNILCTDKTLDWRKEYDCECPKCKKVYHPEDLKSHPIKLKDLLVTLDKDSYIEIYGCGDGPMYYGKVKDYSVSCIDFLTGKCDDLEQLVIYQKDVEINMYDRNVQEKHLARFYHETVRGKGTLIFAYYG